MGELLEAWLLDPAHDNQKIVEYFNTRFGYTEDGAVDQEWNWFDKTKLKRHLERHITNHQEVFQRAMAKGLTGNMSHEEVVRTQLSILNTLREAGLIRVMTGEIGVRNIGDLLRVMDVENKLLGGDKIEIKIGQEGMSIPPEILMKLKGIMGRFVDPHEMEAFREAMDAELFPAFEAYAQAYESQRPKELPESTDERRD